MQYITSNAYLYIPRTQDARPSFSKTNLILKGFNQFEKYSDLFQ